MQKVDVIEQRLYRWAEVELRALSGVALDRIIALLIGAGFLLLRLPFQSSFPVNWDSAQFALGTLDYNLSHHQPHPPGYIGYIFLGKLLNPITGDPNESLTLLSVLAGAIAPAAFFYLAKYFMSRSVAALSAVAFGSSMLVWYYSEVALTYAVELALVLPFLALAYSTIRERELRTLLLATLALAGLGSLRQSALILLVPLWLYIMWMFPWRERIRTSVVFVVSCAIWGVPLLWLAGGPIAYIQASRDLAELVGSQTSLLAFNLVGLAKNLALVAAGLLLGINVGLVVLAFAARNGISWLSNLSRTDRIFFLLWTGPALATFLLGHTGQVGYVLIILPVFFIWLGMAAAGLARWFSRNRLQTKWTRLAPTGALVIFSIINMAGFFVLPRAVVLATPKSVPLDTLQFDVPRNDAHWEEVTTDIRSYPDDVTAVLTTIGGPRVAGSFRQLSFLIPDYPVYGLGNDLNDGSFGVMFEARNGESNYTIEGLQYAHRWLPLDPHVSYLLIPDQEIIDMLDPDLLGYTIPLSVGGGIRVVVIDPGSALVFDNEENMIRVETYDPNAELDDRLNADNLGNHLGR